MSFLSRTLILNVSSLLWLWSLKISSLITQVSRRTGWIFWGSEGGIEELKDGKRKIQLLCLHFSPFFFSDKKRCKMKKVLRLIYGENSLRDLICRIGWMKNRFINIEARNKNTSTDDKIIRRDKKQAANLVVGVHIHISTSLYSLSRFNCWSLAVSFLFTNVKSKPSNSYQQNKEDCKYCNESSIW